MNRLQLACYALLASALALAGLLIVSAQTRLPAAEAAMVISRDNYTFLTAKTREAEEALFVIDNLNERLLVYRVALSGTTGRIELAWVEDLSRLFDRTRTTGGAATGGGRTPR